MSTQGELSSRWAWFFDTNELGRAVLLVQLILSPLLFSIDTIESPEHPKAALLALPALVLPALGICSWLRSVDGFPQPGSRQIPCNARLVRPPAASCFPFRPRIHVGSISPALSFRGRRATPVSDRAAYVVLFSPRAGCAASTIAAPPDGGGYRRGRRLRLRRPAIRQRRPDCLDRRGVLDDYYLRPSVRSGMPTSSPATW